MDDSAEKISEICEINIWRVYGVFFNTFMYGSFHALPSKFKTFSFFMAAKNIRLCFIIPVEKLIKTYTNLT